MNRYKFALDTSLKQVGAEVQLYQFKMYDEGPTGYFRMMVTIPIVVLTETISEKRHESGVWFSCN